MKLHAELKIKKVCLNFNRGRLTAARGSNMDRKEKIWDSRCTYQLVVDKK